MHATCSFQPAERTSNRVANEAQLRNILDGGPTLRSSSHTPGVGGCLSTHPPGGDALHQHRESVLGAFGHRAPRRSGRGWRRGHPQLVGYNGTISYFPARRLAVVVFTTLGPRSELPVQYSTEALMRIARILTPRSIPNIPSRPRG